METLDVDADDGRLRKRIEFEAEKVSQAQRNAPFCNQRRHTSLPFFWTGSRFDCLAAGGYYVHYLASYIRSCQRPFIKS